MSRTSDRNGTKASKRRAVQNATRSAARKAARTVQGRRHVKTGGVAVAFVKTPDLSTLTVPELRALASDRGLHVTTKTRRADLLSLLA